MSLSPVYVLLVSSAAALAGEKESLGRQLFFDKRLSADDTVSCAYCHRPDRAFTDGRPTSQGIQNRAGHLNAPTVLNRAASKRHFWDGRAPSLEKQAEGPLLNEIEMGNTRSGLEEKLNSIPAYRARFARVFGDPQITFARVTEALAAYERTLESCSNLYDDWRRGRREHWTAEHELGRQLFFGPAGCAKCHQGPKFTNDALIPDGSGKAWKVPSLRELFHTAPYFHDGRFPTVDAVLEQHGQAPALDPHQRRALRRFLESLTGDYTR